MVSSIGNGLPVVLELVDHPVQVSRGPIGELLASAFLPRVEGEIFRNRGHVRQGVQRLILVSERLGMDAHDIVRGWLRRRVRLRHDCTASPSRTAITASAMAIRSIATFTSSARSVS